MAALLARLSSVQRSGRLEARAGRASSVMLDSHIGFGEIAIAAHPLMWGCVESRERHIVRCLRLGFSSGDGRLTIVHARAPAREEAICRGAETFSPYSSDMIERAWMAGALGRRRCAERLEACTADSHLTTAALCLKTRAQRASAGRAGVRSSIDDLRYYPLP